MIDYIILAASSLSFITIYKNLHTVKKDSHINKLLFVDEFYKSELNNHAYTKNNYLLIKREIESKYPLLDYLNNQDHAYTKCIFQENKDSIRHTQALEGKRDIVNLKQAIEFDTLRACFLYICKNDNNCKTNTFLYRNKQLISLFTKDIIFTKKINNYFIFLLISLSIWLFFTARLLLNLL